MTLRRSGLDPRRPLIGCLTLAGSLALAGCSQADGTAVVAASSSATAGATASPSDPVNPSATTGAALPPQVSSGDSATASTGGAGSSTSVASGVPGQPTYLVECVDSNLVQQPTSFPMSCADSGSGLDRLAWTAWGSTTSTATGEYTENDCDPSCAQGTVRRYPVRVVASRLHSRGRLQVYTSLQVTFTAKVPTGETKTSTLTLPD